MAQYRKKNDRFDSKEMDQLVSEAIEEADRARAQANGCWYDPKHQEKPQKCADWAATLRLQGNDLYRLKKYDEAMWKYNESICAAPNDSVALAMGYANRSAVFYAKGFYGMALVNIDLAKKYNYPDQLMPKILTREENCRQKVGTAEDRVANLPPSEIVSSNSKIPFLASGISGHRHPKRGPIMVADRAFIPGVVILREKPMVACVAESSVFGCCNHCSSDNMLHLIPCPNCTWAMFCDEACLRKGQNLHRFECGISGEICRYKDSWKGPRLFFHGLSLFDDDITKMMKFCKDIQGTDSSFFDLDYSNYDPLEEFRTFLTAKPRRPINSGTSKEKKAIQATAATMFGMYMKVPLVQSLIISKEQKDFMQQCFADYLNRSLCFNIKVCIPQSSLFPIASCFEHSCDPNALAIDYGDELRIITLRPISRGDPIHFTYGPMYYLSPVVYAYAAKQLGFECVCDFCDKKKRREWMAKSKLPNPFEPDTWATLNRMYQTAPHMLSQGFPLKALCMYLQMYEYFHPQKQYAEVVRMYTRGLEDYHNREMCTIASRKICG